VFKKVFIKRSNNGRQRKHTVLQDLTGLEIYISMKASNTENRIQTGFQQPKSSLRKKPVLTYLVQNDKN